MKIFEYYFRINCSYFILFLILAIFLNVEKSLAYTLSIKGDRVNLRKEPTQKSVVLYEYGNGFPVEIIRKQGSWYFVKDFEGDSGWVHRTKLKKGKQVIVKANKGEENKINIRTGPSTETPIIANAYYGVVLTVIETKGLWTHIRHESGVSGWVSADLLWGF